MVSRAQHARRCVETVAARSGPARTCPFRPLPLSTVKVLPSPRRRKPTRTHNRASFMAGRRLADETGVNRRDRSTLRVVSPLLVERTPSDLTTAARMLDAIRLGQDL